MRERKNVFIFPCGSEIGLELGKALSHSTYFHAIGGSSVPDHGSYAFEDYIGDLPLVDSPDLLRTVQSLVVSRRIDFIYPAHDSAVALFSGWEEDNLLAAARVVTSPHGTCEIARSKSATYAHLRNVVPTPRVYQRVDEVQIFPVFLKPDAGQGSKDARIAANRRALEYHLSESSNLLILEYLPGEEYTVDCFTDKAGTLRYAEGRQRTRILNGISVNTRQFKDTRFVEIAHEINKALPFRGAWFFQVKARADGELVLMEIAARIAGASCLPRSLGVNLPVLSLFDLMGLEIDILENPVPLVMDRQLHNRYKMDYEFTTVYIDLDDALLEAGKVNHCLLGLLYRFKNERKEIHLVTRHLAKYGERADAVLESLFIDTRLFDQITEVALGAAKSAHVRNHGAIFIDDSFAERKEVSLNARIPVFDVNQAIEVFT